MTTINKKRSAKTHPTQYETRVRTRKEKQVKTKEKQKKKPKNQKRNVVKIKNEMFYNRYSIKIQINKKKATMKFVIPAHKSNETTERNVKHSNLNLLSITHSLFIPTT